MRWLLRSVVLCILMLATVPTPAQAWFEWLDYLSGPGPFYGFKIDVRVWCGGPEAPWKGLRARIDLLVLDTLTLFPKSASDKPPERAAVIRVFDEWTKIKEDLVKSNKALPLFSTKDYEQALTARIQIFTTLDPTIPAPSTMASPQDVVVVAEYFQAQVDRFERATASIASTGIFISLCKNDRTRTVAVEVGLSTLQALSNPDYAAGNTIRLNTITGAVSYRLPLPPDRDFIDIGVSGGMYRFSSRGFPGFSGLTLEPFVDLHGPTSLIDAKGLKQLGGLFTFRLGLVFFPGGFDGAQFASAPTKPTKISGGEGTVSATVFFNLRPLLWRRPPPTTLRAAAVR